MDDEDWGATSELGVTNGPLELNQTNVVAVQVTRKRSDASDEPTKFDAIRFSSFFNSA